VFGESGVVFGVQLAGGVVADVQQGDGLGLQAGAKRQGGEEAYLDKATRRLGGIAYQVAADIQQQIDLEIRVTVLGHIQRGGSPIAFDRILASRFGKAAADLVAQKKFGEMVAVRGDTILSVPIRDAVSRPKYVDPNGELVRTARSLGISFGDRAHE